MRYRKNGKFSALLFPPGFQLLPHNCSLNQSPWDAIPFSTDSDSNFDLDCRPYLLQFERDSRSDSDANISNVRSLDRELAAAIDKKVDADKERNEIGSKDKMDEEAEIEDNRLRPRSQRRAAKKARWLNSNSKDFYYYADFGLGRR